MSFSISSFRIPITDAGEEEMERNKWTSQYSQRVVELKKKKKKSFQLLTPIFLKSFLTSSSHLNLGLPFGLVAYGFHLYMVLATLPLVIATSHTIMYSLYVFKVWCLIKLKDNFTLAFPTIRTRKIADIHRYNRHCSKGNNSPYHVACTPPVLQACQRCCQPPHRWRYGVSQLA